MAATFFFSSILHEVTIVMACQRWNHALFFFSQMMQIPLIICSEKFHWLKSQQALRNWAFWLSMVTFQPFLLCLYTYQAFAYSSSSRSLDVISGTMSVMVVTNATNMA
ncbi:hypothetical protein GGI04_005394 [Coemansia thaxteri]|nr:hypothetical protein GGI04_005394 [Coemansia thaxteri]